MLTRTLSSLFPVLLLLLSACHTSVGPENLYGSWKYVKVVTPSAPAEDLSAEELAAEGASILYTV